jgi:hypothetical protein
MLFNHAQYLWANGKRVGRQWGIINLSSSHREDLPDCVLMHGEWCVAWSTTQIVLVTHLGFLPETCSKGPYGYCRQ